MTEQRRKLLRSIAVGGGAAITGKSLPASWSNPVIGSVVLPAHAQTSLVLSPPPQQPQNYSQTQTVSHSFTDSGNLNVVFDVTGFTPTSDGTLTLTLTDDFSAVTELVRIFIDGTDIGTIFSATGNPTNCVVSGPESVTIPQATLVTAAADGSITVTLDPTPAVNACSGAVDQIIQLDFPV